MPGFGGQVPPGGNFGGPGDFDPERGDVPHFGPMGRNDLHPDLPNDMNPHFGGPGGAFPRGPNGFGRGRGRGGPGGPGGNMFM